MAQRLRTQHERQEVPLRALHPARPRRCAQGSAPSQSSSSAQPARAPCSLRRRSCAVPPRRGTSSQGRSSSTCRTWTRAGLTSSPAAERPTASPRSATTRMFSPGRAGAIRSSGKFPTRGITHHIEGTSFTEDILLRELRTSTAVPGPGRCPRSTCSSGSPRWAAPTRALERRTPAARCPCHRNGRCTESLLSRRSRISARSKSCST